MISNLVADEVCGMTLLFALVTCILGRAVQPDWQRA